MQRTEIDKIKMSEFVHGIIEGIKICSFPNDYSAEVLEDQWITWNDKTDINIWMDDDGNYHACAYDVINGKTQTEFWTELEIK